MRVMVVLFLEYAARLLDKKCLKEVITPGPGSDLLPKSVYSVFQKQPTNKKKKKKATKNSTKKTHEGQPKFCHPTNQRKTCSCR